MADIFLSYASEDLERAKLLAPVLEARGWSVWWDRRIPPGKAFAQVIEQAARGVVLLWSTSSIERDGAKREYRESEPTFTRVASFAVATCYAENQLTLETIAMVNDVQFLHLQGW